MNYVADTHALVWWFTDSPRISAKAAEIFAKCERSEIVILIPSIVIAEALSIFDKKRVLFDFRKLFKKIHDSENFVIIPLDYPVLQKMVTLQDIPELHDKIIASHRQVPEPPANHQRRHPPQLSRHQNRLVTISPPALSAVPRRCSSDLRTRPSSATWAIGSLPACAIHAHTIPPCLTH